jgi:hypothetical protein
VASNREAKVDHWGVHGASCAHGVHPTPPKEFYRGFWTWLGGYNLELLGLGFLGVLFI